MKNKVVTAQDVAAATGQSLHEVARGRHEIAKDQKQIAAEGSSAEGEQ